MKKNKWYWSLIIVSLFMLICMTAGCITISDKKPDARKKLAVMSAPVINSFTVDRDTITQGEQAKLSWDVSGTTTVTISPVVGPMEPVSTALVTPETTITYTLSATNEAGTSTATVQVNVTPVVVDKPDLVITDVWIEVKSIFYKIKNEGSEPSKGSRSFLYVNDIVEDNDYVPALAPGEERTESFGRFVWIYGFASQTSAMTITEKPPQFTVKVCADSEHAIVEHDEGNNCTELVWGQEAIYSFIDNAHFAEWTSGSGKLRYPSPAGSLSGTALIAKTMNTEDGKSHSSVLATYPQQVSKGWIQGRFANFYMDPKSRTLRSKDILIPAKAKFTAEVGFRKGATATAGVRFILGVADESGSVVYFPEIFATYDEQFDLYEVDLSELAGEKRTFILRVEAEDSGEQNWAVWLDPRIIQER